MHDAVYWLGADPYDMEPGGWRPDLLNYAWVCQANAGRAPKDSAGQQQFIADFRMVQNINQCQLVQRHWLKIENIDPATRTNLDTSLEEWRSG